MHRLAVLATLLLGCDFHANVAVTGEPDAAIPLTDAPPGDTTPVMMPTVRRIAIAPGKVTGTHPDFPLLFTASVTSAHPMGFDIYFSTDQAGQAKLAHEIERYQPNELVAWVKVPSLSQGTQLYLHYGNTQITTSQENRAGVWTAAYAAVWHLSALDDATATNPATATGSVAAAGKIADARGFDGNGDLLVTGSGDSLDNIFAGGGTMEAWINATSYGEQGFGRIFDKAGTLIGMCNGNLQGTAALMLSRLHTGQNAIWCTTENVLPLNQWIHVAVTYDDSAVANRPIFYINGVVRGLGGSVDNPTGTPLDDGDSPLVIGNRDGGGRAFAGRIDEGRLSTVRRSGEWIATTYENQQDPVAFFVLSPPL